METETKTETKIELTEKMKSVMDSIEKMTVMELADLVKALEEKFGVSASAPVAVAAVGAAAGAAPAAAAEEKTVFTVVLTSAGANKITVIKELRTLTSLGLKEAKDLVDAAPKTIKEGATKEEADKIKKQLETAGAKIELK
jgi:large subunit ribosomal protein L7/L12